MDKVEGIVIQGEKIGLEKKAGKENKMVVNLHMLAGFTSMSMTVKDQALVSRLEQYPDRKAISVKAEIGVYNGKMYIIAKELVS